MRGLKFNKLMLSSNHHNHLRKISSYQTTRSSYMSF
nr:MAG TPA: hypothetical protein [Bacteriophage sp.]